MNIAIAIIVRIGLLYASFSFRTMQSDFKSVLDQGRANYCAERLKYALHTCPYAPVSVIIYYIVVTNTAI